MLNSREGFSFKFYYYYFFLLNPFRSSDGAKSRRSCPLPIMSPPSFCVGTSRIMRVVCAPPSLAEILKQRSCLLTLDVSHCYGRISPTSRPTRWSLSQECCTRLSQVCFMAHESFAQRVWGHVKGRICDGRGWGSRTRGFQRQEAGDWRQKVRSDKE